MDRQFIYSGFDLHIESHKLPEFDEAMLVYIKEPFFVAVFQLTMYCHQESHTTKNDLVCAKTVQIKIGKSINIHGGEEQYQVKV